MKLQKVYFNAFKSLLNKELNIDLDCIGLVGTNESGKSNILSAINVIGGSRNLMATDSPKMQKSKNPSLKYLFKLSDAEIKEFSEVLLDWRKKHAFPMKFFETQNLQIYYNVVFDKQANIEKRYFSIEGIKLDGDSLILDYNKLNDPYKIRHGNDFVPLSQAIIIKAQHITSDEKHRDSYKEISKLESQISSGMAEIQGLKEKLSNLTDMPFENSGFKEVLDKKIAEESLNIELFAKQKNLDAFCAKKSDLESKVNEFNVENIILDLKTKILEIEAEIVKRESDLIDATEKISALKATPETEEQKNEVHMAIQSVENLTFQLKELQSKKQAEENYLACLAEPLKNKYSSNLSEIHKHLKDIVTPFLNKLLPKVVFWEHNKNYILDSETLFSNLLNKESLNDISRPLVNVFRIGLGIESIEDLKKCIIEIQNDPSERSRLTMVLTKKINEFRERTWVDYDQSLRITLEHERIRIEIFDPKAMEDAGHYSMEERSQGCKTFLSFLLTIGAEADQGVLKNHILLLDEPENHLHPSGVRYMLQQLIKIADRGNTVLYATHSIFLIDRDKFDRHVIVQKEKENTLLQPANVGRVGYFMQEEVLYRTLDTKLGSDFSFTKEINFVFEGDGDVKLFEFFYEKVLNSDKRPFALENTSFHQGGKCSDIKKFFTQRPIQLGTKWIFVLDKDKSADELRKFLEGRYKDYLNKDIYIFQYSNEQKKVNDVELEDLLTSQFMAHTYTETMKVMGISCKEEEIGKHVTDDALYKKYDEQIIKDFIPEAKIDEFKAMFKEKLNLRIKDIITPIKSEEVFKTTFPKYNQWINEVIGLLQKSKTK